MFQKLFAMVALGCFSLHAQDVSFCPLEENEYKSSVFPVPYVKKTKVYAQALNKLPKHMNNQVHLANLIEVSPGSHNIIINFRLNERIEGQSSNIDPIGFIIPTGFPLDAAHALAMGRQGLKEEFDIMKGEVLAYNNKNHPIGTWISGLAYSPEALVTKFYQALDDVRQENITACCQKNKEWVKEFNEFSHNNYKHINITIVKEFCRLFAFNFGGEVQDNPASGISAKLKIRSISKEIQTKGKQRHTKAYKKYLLKELNAIVTQLNLYFDPEENVFKLKK